MNFGLYYRTIRHLRLRQVVFQVWNRLRGRPRLRWAASNVPTNVPKVVYPKTVSFLNQSVTFETAIDWNYAANGKLWTYNLNYFEFLAHASRPDGLAMIYEFIRQTDRLIDGLEPYPISLRVINWRAFLKRHGVHDEVIKQHLYAQTALLRSRLEYHLGANHLLENACALAIMAVHFQHEKWFLKAARLLRAELAEQILTDGGHYERSPVYHQLLTDRLLDVYETLRDDAWTPDRELLSIVAETLGRMLGWLEAVTFRNGDVPMVNDAAYGVAPTTAQLRQKATYLSLSPTPVKLGESGYRMLTTPRLECFIDVGPVGPDHQPGHAHADTLSFLLHVDNQPVIVDVGTSTYQPGDQRTWERSTAAHNTVTVAEKYSSEIWGGFRLGRRATVEILMEGTNKIVGRHGGYVAELNCYHTRSYELKSATEIQIVDEISNPNLWNKYRNFFDPSLYLDASNGGIQLGKLTISYLSAHPTQVHADTYELATGFNRRCCAHCLTIDFTQALTTVITVHP